MKSAVFSAISLAAGLLILGMRPQPAAAEVVTVGGTGAALGTIERLGAAFTASHPDISIDVPPSLGSGGGIKALANGAIDLAVSARPPKSSEPGEGMHAMAFAKTAIAFAVHRSVDVASLSTEQLVALYAGRQSQWPNGQPVRLLLRPRVEFDTKMVGRQFPPLPAVLEAALETPAIPVLYTDQEMAAAIETTEHAIGFVALSVLRSESRRVNTLALNGIAPTPATIAEGSYPLVKTLYLLLPSNAKNGTIRFLSFIRSPAGRQIIEDAGSQALDFRWPGGPTG